MVETPANTGDRVRTAAITLFATKGYEGTGIRDIGRQAGLSSASLYHYAGSKQDLLFSIMMDGHVDLIESGQAAIQSAPTCAGRLAALVRQHVIKHGPGAMLALVLDGELKSLESNNLKKIVSLRDRYEDLWRQVIRQGSANGEFEPRDETLVRLALLEMCNGVGHWYQGGGRLRLKDIADGFVSIAFDMVRRTHASDAASARPIDLTTSRTESR